MTEHAYFLEIVQLGMGYIITGAQWKPKVLHIEMHQNPLDIIYLARSQENLNVLQGNATFSLEKSCIWFSIAT